MLNNYEQEFRLMYHQIFGAFPNPSVKYHCRYRRGLSIYHSLSYKRRNNSASYNVCIKIENDYDNPFLCYGQILFFFYVKNKPFFFCKRFVTSKNKFSSLLKPMADIPNWSMYIDKYYQVVHRSTSDFVIFPCSFILCKSIFCPLDDEFLTCTPIELEQEHD